MTPALVARIFLAIFLAVILWDVYLAYDKRKGNTISSVLRSLWEDREWLYHLSSFGLGFLMGHWAPTYGAVGASAGGFDKGLTRFKNNWPRLLKTFCMYGMGLGSGSWW